MAFEAHFFLLIVVYASIVDSLVPTLDNNNPLSHSFYVSDICDWQGSRSPSIPERSVKPIYLRCSRGNIKWFFPNGGLRIVLKLGNSNNDFRGCIRVSRNTTRNARIYVAGKQQLYQIFAFDDGHNEDLLRCFVSYNSFIALFVEIEPQSQFPNDNVIFSYDLEAAKKETFGDDMHVCKPCSDQQILSLYCSADFALTGMVTYFHDRPEVELSEFIVKPSYISRFAANSTYINDFNLLLSNSTSELNQHNIIENGQLSRITLHRLLKCDLRVGLRSKYLFLGRKSLGYYFITCAPKLSHWKQISNKAVETGQNQCHLAQET